MKKLGVFAGSTALSVLTVSSTILNLFLNGAFIFVLASWPL